MGNNINVVNNTYWKFFGKKSPYATPVAVIIAQYNEYWYCIKKG